jgi:uncharacterized damage-inducible protein DinB
MHRYFLLIATTALAGTIQAADTVSLAADLKQSYEGVKDNILKAAEKMPEEDYSFAPTKEERNFGGWVAHVADAQMGGCSRIAGTPKNIKASSKTSKSDLVAALKESFEMCDAVYNATTDANANDPVPSFRGQTARAAALYGNFGHDQECYGTMAVYLRLKGIVPPSTEAMAKLRGKARE